MSRELSIFRSERAFVIFFSQILLFAGFFSLCFALLCRFLQPGFCQDLFIPMFGGFDLVRHELALFNLPLAMVIMGLGLRLFTAFGWFTCLSLGTVLGVSFGYLAFLLGTNIDRFVFSRVERSAFSFADHPILESIFVNGLLALISFLFVIYLSLKSTRRLYFEEKNT